MPQLFMFLTIPVIQPASKHNKRSVNNPFPNEKLPEISENTANEMSKYKAAANAPYNNAPLSILLKAIIAAITAHTTFIPAFT